MRHELLKVKKWGGKTFKEYNADRIINDSTYKNGAVYKTIDVGSNLCYICSTIQPLSKRFHHYGAAKGCSSAMETIAKLNW